MEKQTRAKVSTMGAAEQEVYDACALYFSMHRVVEEGEQRDYLIAEIVETDHGFAVHMYIATLGYNAQDRIGGIKIGDLPNPTRIALESGEDVLKVLSSQVRRRRDAMGLATILGVDERELSDMVEGCDNADEFKERVMAALPEGVRNKVKLI